MCIEKQSKTHQTHGKNRQRRTSCKEQKIEILNSIKQLFRRHANKNNKNILLNATSKRMCLQAYNGNVAKCLLKKLKIVHSKKKEVKS